MCILLVVRATLLDSFIFPLIDISSEAGSIAKYMLLIVCLVTPLRAVNVCNVVGVFRGGGDVNYALKVDIGPLYCICVPSAALCGLVFGLGIEVVYLCIAFDDLAKTILCLPHLRSGRWINSVTRSDAS